MGALCTTCARCFGIDMLRQKLIDPMRAGTPPFVLSDAFPGDLLPIPHALRLLELPQGVDAKAVKRAKWLSADDFRKACLGEVPPIDAYLPDPVHYEVSRHNSLSRDSGGSLEDGGLFARPDTMLAQGADALTLYFRATDISSTELLLDLLYELSLTGFGADIATGRGQFDIEGDPIANTTIDKPIKGTNAVIVLSTFQPGTNDLTVGCWETFPKFGKIGPSLGVTDVRKNTMMMFRPGACFASADSRPFLGHAISMDRLLGSERSNDLRSRDIEIIHPAFGLTVPARLELDLLR